MTKNNNQHYKNADIKKPFKVYLLQEDQINNFILLQAETANRANGHYLKVRLDDDVKNQLEAGNLILGVKDNNNEHIAQCVLADPKLDATHNIDAFKEYENYLVIQSVAFKDGFRPKQLAEWDYKEKPDFLLLEKTKEIAKEKELKQIFAKVNASNKGSIHLFERAGFTASTPQKVGQDNYMSCIMSFNIAVTTKITSVAAPIKRELLCSSNIPTCP